MALEWPDLGCRAAAVGQPEPNFIEGMSHRPQPFGSGITPARHAAVVEQRAAADTNGGHELPTLTTDVGVQQESATAA